MQESAWRRLADDIAEKIQSGELAVGDRIEPESEMAKRLGISRHTAHRALHELQRQGLVSRLRRWGTVVAAPRQNRLTSIAYLADFTSNQFQTDILSHIEHELPAGERLVVATSRNDPEREAEHLEKLSQEVGGIICYPAEGDANCAAIRALADKGFPIVLVDRAPRGCEDLVVLTDNRGAACDAVARLAERGHKQIAFFGNSSADLMSIRERYEGWKAGAAELGSSGDRLARWIPMRLDQNSNAMFQAISDALAAMRSKPDPPTAAFCSQDWLAFALVQACEDEKLEVGQDFDIATYNDFGPRFFRYPQRLDRIIQRVDLISREAMRRLEKLMAGEPVPPGPIRIPATSAPIAFDAMTDHPRAIQQ